MLRLCHYSVKLENVSRATRETSWFFLLFTIINLFIWSFRSAQYDLKNHIAIIPQILWLWYDLWLVGMKVLHHNFHFHRKRIHLLGSVPIKHVHAAGWRSPKLSNQQVTCPLGLSVKSQCKTENWNKTKMLQYSTCSSWCGANKLNYRCENVLTEVVGRSQSGEDAGEELQTDLDLRTVAVPATMRYVGSFIHHSSFTGLYNRVSTGYSQQKVVRFLFFSALSQFLSKQKCVWLSCRLTDSQCKLVPVFMDFLDVVLQVVEEQLHHVQLLLSPPDRTNQTPSEPQYKHAKDSPSSLQFRSQFTSQDQWGLILNKWEYKIYWLLMFLTWWSSECRSWSRTAGKCQKVWVADAKKPQRTWRRRENVGQKQEQKKRRNEINTETKYCLPVLWTIKDVICVLFFVFLTFKLQTQE